MAQELYSASTEVFFIRTPMSVNILERSLIKLELMLELIWSVGQLGESLFYDWRHSALLVLILQVTISTITDNKHHGDISNIKHRRERKRILSVLVYTKNARCIFLIISQQEEEQAHVLQRWRKILSFQLSLLPVTPDKTNLRILLELKWFIICSHIFQ